MPKPNKVKTPKQKLKDFKMMHPKGTQIEIPQIEKPKVSELARVLKGYVSASISERLNALSSALLWYNDALPYVMLNADLIPSGEDNLFKKATELSTKCRNQALGTSNLEERDAALRQAIKQLEKCFVKFEVPKLDTYIARYDTCKATYERREANLKAKFGNVLTLVEKALGLPFALSYCRDCQAYKQGESVHLCQEQQHILVPIALPLEHLAVENRKDVPRRLNPSLKTYFFNQNSAVALYSSMRAEGAVPVLLRELRTLARQSAAEPSVDGKHYLVNRNRLLAIYEQGLENLELWVKDNELPFKLAKKATLSLPVANGEKKATVGGSTCRIDDTTIRAWLVQELKDTKPYIDRKGKVSPLKLIYAMRASGKSSGWPRFLRILDDVQKGATA